MRNFWREETRRIAVLKEQDKRVWAGIIWLRVGAPTNGGAYFLLCVDSFGMDGGYIMVGISRIITLFKLFDIQSTVHRNIFL
jgi:hypothetical protein